MPELFLNGKHMVLKKGYRLKVFWDGKEIHGIIKILQSGTLPAPIVPSKKKRPHMELDEVGMGKGFVVVMKRGRNADQTFREWFTSSRDPSSTGNCVSKDIDIKVLDENDIVLASYSLLGCVPTGFLSMPGLITGGETAGMEELRLESEGLVIEDLERR